MKAIRTLSEEMDSILICSILETLEKTKDCFCKKMGRVLYK